MIMEIGKYYSLCSLRGNYEHIDYVIKIIDKDEYFFIIKYFCIATNYFCDAYKYEIDVNRITHEISKDLYFSYLPDGYPDKISYLRKQKIKSLIG